MSHQKYFATTAKGIEIVTAEELKRMGASQVEVSFGGVYFQGDLEVLYKANLWCRTATRILMPLREFAAKTPEMLYDQVRRIKWENYLNSEKTFAVDCTIAGSKSLRPAPGRPLPVKTEASPLRSGLNHSRYAALKIKDAIVDQLRMKQGVRPDVDVEKPNLRVVAYLHGGRCTLSLDSSGSSLHERGYRIQGGKAPLKENLAAAILELSEWDPATPFMDPMCGSGTLVLEAAMRALNIAPGLFRDYWGFLGWPDFDEALWHGIVEKAQGEALKRLRAPIVGYDASRDAIAVALENSKRASLTRHVHFERRDLDALQPTGEKPGTLVVNPPYGERLGQEKELESLYSMLGDLFKQRLKGWNAFIFTGNLGLAKHVGLRASRRIELYNGPIECRLLRYEMYAGSAK